MRTPDWLKPGLMGAVCGAIVMSIVGFSQLGWVSATTADKMAREQSDTAVVAAMVPYCVAKAKQPSQTDALAKLNAEKSMYSRNDIVSSAGWATLGDDKFPDNALARACAAKLVAAAG